MTDDLKPCPPMCHLMPMQQTFADDWPNGQVEFYECLYCGHTKDMDEWNRRAEKEVKP